MATLGKFNSLTVIKRVDFGYYLDGDEHGDILLPKKYADSNTVVGDILDVFLYNDSEDRIIATTLKPKAVVGECAYLKVVQINKFGAFFDWGLPKDLLVPFNQQQKPMQQGYSYTIFLYVDEASERIVASSRLEEHLDDDASSFQARDKVELMIYGKSDLGYKAVINGSHLGQLYENEMFRQVHYGEKLVGYIKQVRSDGKVDLSLQLPSHLARGSLADAILRYLNEANGISYLTDKSKPEDIYAAFGVSKANYKKALGSLYKNKMINIEKHQITLLRQD